jgi:hypothetical protein
LGGAQADLRAVAGSRDGSAGDGYNDWNNRGQRHDKRQSFGERARAGRRDECGRRPKMKAKSDGATPNY